MLNKAFRKVAAGMRCGMMDRTDQPEENMLARIARLFTIKTRIEAFTVIYALAIGAADRGRVYLDLYPGSGGKLLFAACMGTVVIAGAKILDCIRYDKHSRRGRT